MISASRAGQTVQIGAYSIHDWTLACQWGTMTEIIGQGVKRLLCFSKLINKKFHVLFGFKRPIPYTWFTTTTTLYWNSLLNSPMFSGDNSVSSQHQLITNTNSLFSLHQLPITAELATVMQGKKLVWEPHHHWIVMCLVPYKSLSHVHHKFTSHQINNCTWHQLDLTNCTLFWRARKNPYETDLWMNPDKLTPDTDGIRQLPFGWAFYHMYVIP